MPVNSVTTPVNTTLTAVVGGLSTSRDYLGLQPSVNAANDLQQGEFVDPCRFRFSANCGGRAAV